MTKRTYDPKLKALIEKLLKDREEAERELQQK